MTSMISSKRGFALIFCLLLVCFVMQAFVFDLFMMEFIDQRCILIVGADVMCLIHIIVSAYPQRTAENAASAWFVYSILMAGKMIVLNVAIWPQLEYGPATDTTAFDEGEHSHWVTRVLFCEISSRLIILVVWHASVFITFLWHGFFSIRISANFVIRHNRYTAGCSSGCSIYSFQSSTFC